MGNAAKEKRLTRSEQPLGSLSESSETSSITSANEAVMANSLTQEQSTTTEVPKLTGVKLYGILSALILATLVFSLDTLILATAIPKITDEFKTVVDIGWYATSYMLCNSALQPLTGKFYSYFNLTYTFVVFMAIFMVGSIVCAAAPSSNALIIGRAIAGIGGSGLVNGSMTMLGVAAPPEQRPALVGFLMAIMGLAQIIAPLIGGALSQYASWRWCFWINLPCAAAVIVVLLIIKVPNPNVKKDLTLKTFIKRFDIVGFCIFAPSCVMILIALQWGGNQYAWKSATIIGLIVGSVVGFALFVAWEIHHGDDAMFPSSLLKQRIVYSSIFTSALQFGALFVVGYYLSLWFQAIKRTSPTMSAVSTLPTFGLQILGVAISSALVTRIGYFTPFALFGGVLLTVGTGLMTTFTPTTGIGKWFGYQILTGIGRGLCFQQPINAVQADLSGAQMATGMAIIAWAQFFGGALFIGLAETMFTNLLQASLNSSVPSIESAAVIYAGATNYLYLTPEGPLRQALLLAYNKAITQTFYLSAAAGTVGTLTALGMGWKRVLKAKEKPASKKDSIIAVDKV